MDRRTRIAWLSAGVIALASVAVGVRLIREGPAPQAAVPPPPPGVDGMPVPAPDISGLSPSQRFDLLYARARDALDRGDTASAVRLASHALSAYAQLDAADSGPRAGEARTLEQLLRDPARPPRE